MIGRRYKPVPWPLIEPVWCMTFHKSLRPFFQPGQATRDIRTAKTALENTSVCFAPSDLAFRARSKSRCGVLESHRGVVDKFDAICNDFKMRGFTPLQLLLVSHNPLRSVQQNAHCFVNCLQTVDNFDAIRN
jgi:hypothetical protein